MAKYFIRETRAEIRYICVSFNPCEDTEAVRNLPVYLNKRDSETKKSLCELYTLNILNWHGLPAIYFPKGKSYKGFSAKRNDFKAFNINVTGF